jgi:formylglycine-generating enzyme required for sulfatase activity
VKPKALVTLLCILTGIAAQTDADADADKVDLTIPADCTAATGASAGADGWADRIVHDKTGIELVLMPAGTFTMGSVEARPPHDVHIKEPFYMGTTEVTNATYRRFLEATSYDGQTDTDPAYDLYLRHFRGKSMMSAEDDYPIVWVSWNNATAFCTWAGLKLPTEAQWEFACRAGTSTLFFFGDDDENAGDYGWSHTNSKALTHPVAGRKPNDWGLYDMPGNVWEWVEDDFVGSYEGAPVDGSARLEGKLTKALRGGSWSNSTWFWVSGSSARFNTAPGNASNDMGFRVALPIED